MAENLKDMRDYLTRLRPGLMINVFWACRVLDDTRSNSEDDSLIRSCIQFYITSDMITRKLGFRETSL